MTHRYRIQFLTEFNPALSLDKPISFPNPVHLGDVIQLPDSEEYHLVRLVIHSPAHSTLLVAGSQLSADKLFLTKEHHPLLDALDAQAKAR